VTSCVRGTLGAALALALLVCARPAAAQTTPPEDPPPPTIELLPRAAFHLTAEHLSGEDVKFVWDTNFGGELDVIGYRHGRATFVANYQAILGDELRHFDPNQGNYIQSGSLSFRTNGVELAGVFYHQSRHLSDRPNRVAVAWNMLGGRALKSFTAGRTRVQARVDLRGAVQKSFVDYDWELDTGVRSDVHIGPGLGALFAADLRYLGVDGTQNRGNQTGYRAEAGIRIEGRGGAMEFFLATERRIDPSPLEFGVVRWMTAGFRLLSR
jgi:hypothetical protein